MAASVEQTFGATVEQERVRLPVGEAGRLTYEIETDAFASRADQYLVMAGDWTYIVTFSRLPGTAQADLDAVFRAVMETFEATP